MDVSGTWGSGAVSFEASSRSSSAGESVPTHDQIILHQLQQPAELRRALELGHILDDERPRLDLTNCAQEVLPQLVQLGTTGVIAVPPQRAEPLTRGPADDDVSWGNVSTPSIEPS